MSRSLDFVGGLKKRAVAARGYRIQISSKSGTKFRSQESFQIELPTIARSYADLANMYLMFDIKSTSANDDNTGTLCSSAYDLFNRITISSGGGAVIDDCTNINRYYNAVLTQSVSHEFMQGYSAECIGHSGDGGSPLGIKIPSAANSDTAKTICIPLLHSVATCSKLLPLDTAQGLNFTFYLEDFRNALVCNTADNELDDYEISSPRLLVNLTELSPETEMTLQQAVQPIGFNMNFTGLNCVMDTKANDNAGTHTTNLGFRYSSLSKITLLMFDKDGYQKTDQLTINNRSYANLNELSYFINGVRYPQQKMLGSAHNMGEFLTETFLSNHLLTDIYHNSHINFTGIKDYTDKTGSVSLAMIDELHKKFDVNQRNYEVVVGKFSDNIGATLNRTHLNNFGTFLVSYNFESFKTPVDDSGLISGISTLGGNVMSELSFASGGPSTGVDLYYYAEVEKILSVDPLTRSFVVSD